MDEILDILGFNSQLVLGSPLLKNPWPHYLIHYLLLTLIVSGPPCRGFRRVMIAPMVIHLFKSPLCIISVGGDVNPVCGVLHGVVIGQIFNATLAILAGTPVEYTDYRLNKGLDLDRLSIFTWGKFKWAFERCFVNMRGVGWNWEYRYVDNRPIRVNKWWFIIIKCQIWETFIKYIGYDICVSIQEFLQDDDCWLNSLPLVWMFIDSVTFTYIMYYSLNACYFQMASLSLALGLSDVSQWPDMFQIFHNGISLRAFWTVWWHQYLTMDSVKISNWLVGVNNGALSVMTVFTINGMVHVYGTMCSNSGVVPWRSLLYFMLSGVNLIVERKFWKWRFFLILLQVYVTRIYHSELLDSGLNYPIYNNYISFRYILNEIWR